MTCAQWAPPRPCVTTEPGRRVGGWPGPPGQPALPPDNAAPRRPDHGPGPAPFEPVDPEKFAKDLADGINKVINDEALRAHMEIAGRKRVEDFFDWKAIAKQTENLYKSII